MVTYRLSHPQLLSEPLEIDSHVERTDRALADWASIMYLLRKFDEVVTLDEWTIEQTG